MPRNVEIKARVDDLAAVRTRVEELTTGPAEHLTQTDTFFEVPNGRLKLRQLGDGTAELIYYERPDVTGPKASTYTRCPVADAALLQSVLAASVGIRGVVEKERDVFFHEQTRIHLDRVEGLGTFLELEVAIDDDEPLSTGEAIARDILQFLNVGDQDLVASAYIDLLTAD
ncbi:CYTH domain protein [Maioricimonas rarisocia]|uniref:CYTH domain protein n=1 Tax=Maioricimonas rarisocia TaxID=2528026 RepID=A0A517Z7N0_9PLAN|nr:class IV adenylate cyclase [Maioricimonas rarisocia]QDU38485.1 CYTH domain protein [Maioricimonas rarisocia]